MNVVPSSISSTNQLFTQSEYLRKRSHSKLSFRIRCIILITIAVIFYTRFVVSSYLQTENQIDQNDAIPIKNWRRKILSLTNSTDTFTATTTTSLVNCTPAAILYFPSDGFTREERQQGWILLHIIVAFYCFWISATICDEYFVPAIEQLCLTLKMEKDVIGATFMAAAVSSPELFMNFVGTFVTKGDIGIGAIVGSSVFNILAVPACCGLFIAKYIRLDWWPVTRDCLMYCIAVLALIGILYDGKVMWYEAVSLIIGYFIYMTIMYYNDKVAITARKLSAKYRRKLRRRMRPYRQISEITPLSWEDSNWSNNNGSSKTCDTIHTASTMLLDIGDDENEVNSLQSINSDNSYYADSPWELNDHNLYAYMLRWPITLLLWITIPDSRRYPKWKYLTLTISIIWIGAISYGVTFLITILGDTLNIPDSVMGLTILAAGMSVPEAISSIIVTKRGQGSMGISNSIGSNTFDILLCLGLPWSLKAYFLPDHPNEHWVILNSSGLTYASVFLITTLLGFYTAFATNRFTINWKLGITCTVMYIIFMSIATMVELNVFFPVNLPICEH